MRKGKKIAKKDEMLEEYDFSGGVRGKYAGRYRKGSNIVILDPDVASVFRDSRSVNSILRPFVHILHKQAERS